MGSFAGQDLSAGFVVGVSHVSHFDSLYKCNTEAFARYLPPPVLEILDNKQLEGVKRAALLTTALKYALDRVPTAMIPPQARPAMRLLKACTPYLGYVGGFVAWSWSAVKSFDKGASCSLQP